jgi:hypothetical protein
MSIAHALIVGRPGRLKIPGAYSPRQQAPIRLDRPAVLATNE